VFELDRELEAAVRTESPVAVHAQVRLLDGGPEDRLEGNVRSRTALRVADAHRRVERLEEAPHVQPERFVHPALVLGVGAARLGDGGRSESEGGRDDEAGRPMNAH
jgi:hypothetical protein